MLQAAVEALNPWKEKFTILEVKEPVTLIGMVSLKPPTELTIKQVIYQLGSWRQLTNPRPLELHSLSQTRFLRLKPNLKWSKVSIYKTSSVPILQTPTELLSPLCFLVTDTLKLLVNYQPVLFFKCQVVKWCLLMWIFPLLSKILLPIPWIHQKDISDCASSLSIDDILNQVNYGFQVSTDATKGPSCIDSTQEVVDSISNQPIDFNITMKMGDIPDGTITLDKVLMDVDEYTNERCDGMLYSASRVVVTVKASSSREDFTPQEVADGSVFLDDSQLVRNETWCDDAPTDGSKKTFYFKYKSEECFPMTVEEDTCKFAYMGFFNFNMEYDYVKEAKKLTRSIEFNQPVINSNTFKGDECPQVAEQEDVTITTSVELLLEGLDFNSDLKATLRFTELNDDSQVTMRIVSIEASIVGTDIMRTFNVDEKLKLMSFPVSKGQAGTRLLRDLISLRTAITCASYCADAGSSIGSQYEGIADTQ